MLDKPSGTTKPLLPKETTNLLLGVLYNFFPVVIFFVCALLLISVWFYKLEPKYKEISSGEALAAKREEYYAQGEYYKKLVEFRNAYKAISQADIDKINKIVDVPNDANDLYKELEYLAKINGMIAVEIMPKVQDDSFEIANLAVSNKRNDLVSQTRVWKTDVSLSEVSYTSLVNFLSSIEYNLRLMDVQKLSYDPILKTATLELLTYHRK